MLSQFVVVGLVLVCLVAGGCQALGEKLGEGSTPAGSTTQPSADDPAGLGPGWELAPQAEYSASQSAGQVTITARGQHPSAGYEAKLVQSPLRIWPPQYQLAVKKPDGMAATVMTPFEVKATFKADDPLETISVRDERGLRRVPVEQAPTP